jgi:hypothetical protein
MRVLLLLITLAAAPALCSAEEKLLYVQSAKATLMAEPAFGAASVAELERGTAVNELESRKRWLKVRVGKKSGWVSRFLLSAHPPLKKVTVLDEGEQKDIEKNARRRASAVTTAGAARGLSADERRRADDHNRADFHALERLEQIKVSAEELSRFAAEGELK